MGLKGVKGLKFWLRFVRYCMEFSNGHIPSGDKAQRKWTYAWLKAPRPSGVVVILVRVGGVWGGRGWGSGGKTRSSGTAGCKWPPRPTPRWGNDTLSSRHHHRRPSSPEFLGVRTRGTLGSLRPRYPLTPPLAPPPWWLPRGSPDRRKTSVAIAHQTSTNKRKQCMIN